MSATAKKDEMELIAVVIDGETSKSRFQDAKTLLNYGYANYKIYQDRNEYRENLGTIQVNGGVESTLIPEYEKEFTCLLMNGETVNAIEKRLELPVEVQAPVQEGQQIGKLSYYHGEKKLGEVSVIAPKTIEKAKYSDYVKRVWLAWMM